MSIRNRVAALAIAGAVTAGGVGVMSSPASAHSFGFNGPPHVHFPCTPGGGGGSNCARWILANGEIRQGSIDLMISNYGYVLVWCSYMLGNQWTLNTQSWGPWNNTGWHTYCQNPKYSGTPWSLRP